MSAFGGALNGQLRIRGGSAQSVAGDAKGTDLRVEQLLTTFANRDDVKGTMSADASFTTAGKSIAQFMKSLDGKGQFNITEGRYDGLDLSIKSFALVRCNLGRHFLMRPLRAM